MQRLLTVLALSCCVFASAAFGGTSEGNRPIEFFPSESNTTYHLTPEALSALKAKSSFDPAASLRIYQYYKFDQHNESSATAWLEFAAEHGNSDAKELLSHRIKPILAAAEKGDAVAQNQLGTMYCLGAGGVAKDLKVAQKWYKEAILNGSLPAITNLGLLYQFTDFEEHSFKEAIEWYHLAAAKGEVEAQIMLGSFYGSGVHIKKDIQSSKKWFQAAAEQGNPYAQYRVGLLFYNGELGEVNYPEALRWFRQSANQGYPLSIEILSRMYRTAKGLPNSDAEADTWESKPKKEWYPDVEIYCMKPL